MPSPSGSLQSRIVDIVAAAAVIVAGIVALLVTGRLLSGPGLLAIVGIALLAAVTAQARRRPMSAALITAGLMCASLPLRHRPEMPAVMVTLMVAVFFLSYWLGFAGRPAFSIVVLVILGVSWQLLDTDVNPFIIVDTVGAWAIGWAIGSRTRAQQQLEARTYALAAEQALYTAESLRYQRVRIARELHDVVAHAVTVMVVQAAAGEYLVVHDREAARQSLDAISASARQARDDIDRLVGLLDQQRAFPGSVQLAELVEGARAAGLEVNLNETNRSLPPAIADVVYRIVQEAVTNAMKHAPGAAVDIHTASDELTFHVRITNAASRERADLARTGSGRGLAGMRERVNECGGHFTAGPDGQGGWQVSAKLPVILAEDPVSAKDPPSDGRLLAMNSTG